jgi:hypothetical protein
VQPVPPSDQGTPFTTVHLVRLPHLPSL